MSTPPPTPPTPPIPPVPPVPPVPPEVNDGKPSYKNTLNLPKTAFAMKANLVQNEPASMKRWQAMDLYCQLRAKDSPKGRWAFHDGPPYANGSIHLGHLLNKVLKDLVVRSRTMAGYDVPYTPGWDCHGLPIEHKVMQELGPAGREMEAYKVRQKCKASAEKFVKLQKGQMQRLLTVADYDKPYITMDPGYEAAVLEVFARLVDKGLVYRALKPVHWSIENRTALAEAELEYYDREDTSIFVLFEIEQPEKLSSIFKSSGDTPSYLMIWTTTPWTLPANLAVAVAPQADYGLYECSWQGKTIRIVLAEALAEKVLAVGQATEMKLLGRCLGANLHSPVTGLSYRHPFMDRQSPIVTADYVTLEDGTGLVHTAPGHGAEDYLTGKKYGLDIYCPVKADGTFDATVPDWLRGEGVNVWKANDLVIDKLKSTANLFYSQKFIHSYPHDWRGKTPTIFRATEQWFISVEHSFSHDGDALASLRHRAMQAAERQVKFLPEWGRNRMRGMLETRPDWCVSRQRAWGLPIPAILESVDSTSQPLMTAASIRAVAKIVEKHGSDAWFKLSAKELLADYDPASDPQAPAWVAKTLKDSPDSLVKGSDIFDVWFDSGCSWNAALKRMQGDYPAKLYLEGSDQHRGWFQVSLLAGLGGTGQAPFETVLTHGFMVDKDGRKMSKSLGNTVEVEDLLKELGADVCRWWVSSLNTDNDIKVDKEFFRLAGEEYRKVRNTLRFLLSNLFDYQHDRDAYAFSDADATSLDAWALGELNKLIQQVESAYDQLSFPLVNRAIFDFCNQTLSAVYLAATKDRLYCDAPGSSRRRRTQTAMYLITDALIRLTAPILPHTADEAWLALYGDKAQPATVHLADFPSLANMLVSPHWASLMTQRDAMLKTIEQARSDQKVENPLDMGLNWPSSSELSLFDPSDLADLLGISRVQLLAVSKPEVLDLRSQPRCDRSWKRDGTVKRRSDGGCLSDRDAQALGL